MGAFGDELRRLRQRSGMSQELLASRSGLSPEAVSLLERGRRSPRMTTMRLLADGLELDHASRQSLFDAQLRDDPGPRTANPTSGPTLGVPRFLDDLIGRESEVAELTELLSRVHVVTVTGPGGVGKSRVAAEAAGSVRDRFPDGVRWMSMASLADPDGLVPAVTAALGNRPMQGEGLPDLIDFLADRQLLLIFDGAEHLVAGMSDLLFELITGCPRLVIMITSTERLRIPGEAVLTVLPLTIPPAYGSPAAIVAAPAVRLFCERAQLSRELDAAEARAVARICRRLDGLPLALELAAARTQVLSMTELADTLEDTLGILTADSDGTSLTDRVVGWTYRLLTPEEQLLLQRMAVFRSFTHRALAETCRDRWTSIQVLDMITSLVTKSLVSRVMRNGEQSRFTLLEVVRDFAVERLTAAEATKIRDRHAHYFRDLAIAAEPHLNGADQQRWLTTLDHEVSNLRTAIPWLTAHDPASALQLVGSVWRWCYLRGRYTEGRAWMHGALDAAGDADPAVRAAALAGAGLLAFLQCDYAVAKINIEQASTLYAELGDSLRTAWCLTRLGSLAREQGAYENSMTLHQQALAIVRSIGDDHAVGAELNYLCFVNWISGDLDQAEDLGRAAMQLLRPQPSEELIWALINAGVTARCRGDLDGAELLLQHALEISDQLDFREGVAWSHNQLGVVARLNGQHTTARRLQRSSLTEHTRVGDRWRMASVLDELAAIAADVGDYRTAAADLGVADRLRDDIGAPVPAVEREDRERTAMETEVALGPAFHAARLAGSIRSVTTADR